jgi:hypothetical protein
MKKNPTNKLKNVDACAQSDKIVPENLLDQSVLTNYLKRKELSEGGHYWSILSEMQQTTF